MNILVDGDQEALVEVMRKHVDEVAGFSHESWSPAQFLEHNRAAWGEFHRHLRARNRACFEDQMPYLMEAPMEVVARERPDLFPEKAEPAAVASRRELRNDAGTESARSLSRRFCTSGDGRTRGRCSSCR